MFLGSIPLPIVLISSVGGGKSDIGVAMSLCAALEIIVMGVLIWRPLQRGERAAIVVGFAAFVSYFVALAFARSVAAIFWAQILRAIGIGLVSYLGISYLQTLMPHRAGAAAALFSNSGQLGLHAAGDLGIIEMRGRHIVEGGAGRHPCAMERPRGRQ
jgi:SET family sugar efflux transporter-like MFS transporter